jgi:hypothetical protein
MVRLRGARAYRRGVCWSGGRGLAALPPRLSQGWWGRRGGSRPAPACRLDGVRDAGCLRVAHRSSHGQRRCWSGCLRPSHWIPCPLESDHSGGSALRRVPSDPELLRSAVLVLRQQLCSQPRWRTGRLGRSGHHGRGSLQAGRGSPLNGRGSAQTGTGWDRPIAPDRARRTATDDATRRTEKVATVRRTERLGMVRRTARVVAVTGNPTAAAPGADRFGPDQAGAERLPGPRHRRDEDPRTGDLAWTGVSARMAAPGPDHARRTSARSAATGLGRDLPMRSAGSSAASSQAPGRWSNHGRSSRTPSAMEASGRLSGSSVRCRTAPAARRRRRRWYRPT